MCHPANDATREAVVASVLHFVGLCVACGSRDIWRALAGWGQDAAELCGHDENNPGQICPQGCGSLGCPLDWPGVRFVSVGEEL